MSPESSQKPQSMRDTGTPRPSGTRGRSDPGKHAEMSSTSARSGGFSWYTVPVWLIDTFVLLRMRRAYVLRFNEYEKWEPNVDTVYQWRKFQQKEWDRLSMMLVLLATASSAILVGPSAPNLAVSLWLGAAGLSICGLFILTYISIKALSMDDIAMWELIARPDAKLTLIHPDKLSTKWKQRSDRDNPGASESADNSSQSRGPSQSSHGGSSQPSDERIFGVEATSRLGGFRGILEIAVASPVIMVFWSCVLFTAGVVDYAIENPVQGLTHKVFAILPVGCGIAVAAATVVVGEYIGHTANGRSGWDRLHAEKEKAEQP